MRVVLFIAALIGLAASAQAAGKKPIDESCLMVCADEKCEKFVMRCKGDPGYPTASRVTPVQPGAGGGAVLDRGPQQPDSRQILLQQNWQLLTPTK